MREVTKEPMEYFGRAVHTANIFEHSLIFLLTLDATKNERVPQPGRWEALFESGKEKKTLGVLLNQLRKQVSISDEEQRLLKAALDCRNQLVHRFMINNDHKLYDPKGRLELIEGLERLRECIRTGDKVAAKMIDSLLNRFGLSTEILKTLAEEHYASRNFVNVPEQ